MILTLLTLLPLAGALLLMLIPAGEKSMLRGIALSIALLNFVVALFLLPGFDVNAFNHSVDHLWVPALGIHFHLGVDGISLWLVELTAFLMPVVLLSTWRSVEKNVREFVVALLVLETGMIGTFLALDLFVFYVFWELMLIPMYFIIGIWGGSRRLYASLKFVLYTMVGSLLMLVAILFLYVKYHQASGAWSFDYFELSRLVLSPNQQLLCFAAFALAFCIKVPLFPLHTWLPDAHVEAPTAGSVLLAAVMLKFGTYGLLRFAIPFFPVAMQQAAPLLALLSVVGIIYGSLVAFAQTDMKKMIAYSSVAHLGFVVLGLAAFNPISVGGAVYQMLAHGISTGGLFLAIGVIYERRHTRKIDDFGGLAAVMPRFYAVFMIITLASIGLPGLSGFVGEFLVLSGTFNATAMLHYARPLSILATTGVILSAVYMLYLFQKVMYGPVTNSLNQDLPDLSNRELVVFLPMLLMAFWLGLYPSTFQRGIDPAVRRSVAAFVAKSKITVAPDGAPQLMAAPQATAATTAALSPRGEQ